MRTKELLPLLLAVSLTGCSMSGGHKDDPLEGMNRGVYSFNRFVDKSLIKPVAKGYDMILPAVARKGINNFFYNIETVPTIGNDLLQLNMKMAVNDTTRLLVNTTLGLGGLIDVASKFGLEKHKLDFGQTLGKWGYQNSTYIVIPFLGPSTIRDGIGLAGNWYMSPWAYFNDKKWRYGLKGLELIDLRANLLTADKILETVTEDEYSYVRNAYLEKRKNVINGGKEEPVKAGAEDDGFGKVEQVN